jgi:hypothetical protein
LLLLPPLARVLSNRNDCKYRPNTINTIKERQRRIPTEIIALINQDFDT